jgi:hypothetical protein
MATNLIASLMALSTVLLSSCASISSPVGLGSKELRAFLAALKKEQMGMIESFNIPDGTETFGAVTPSYLVKDWAYKTTIRWVNPATTAALTRSLSVIETKSPPQMPDLRHGFVFYAQDGDKVIGSVHFDENGYFGYVGDNVPVQFESGVMLSIKRAIARSQN